MRVALVGNGPSAAGKGREIDVADKVVRMNAFPAIAAEDAGKRLDAWAWFGNVVTAQRMDMTPPADEYEVWATLPPSRCKPFAPQHVGNAARLIEWAAGKLIRWVTEGEYGEQARRLNAWPSTGYTAACIARADWPTAELVLYGFDALAPGGPGWGDARAPWTARDATAHNFAEEKAALRATLGAVFA